MLQTLVKVINNTNFIFEYRFYHCQECRNFGEYHDGRYLHLLQGKFDFGI